MIHPTNITTPLCEGVIVGGRHDGATFIRPLTSWGDKPAAVRYKGRIYCLCGWLPDGRGKYSTRTTNKSK